MSQKANFGCRFCDYPKADWGKLRLDFLSYSRFYYEVTRIRCAANAIPTATTRKTFLTNVGKSISANGIPLQRIVLALDVILTRPSDPAHSELKGIANLLHKLLIKAILTKQAKREYSAILRSFPFPLNWAQLQLPIYHLSSYQMSKHRRQLVIVLILLCTQLTEDYIRPYFKEAMFEVLQDKLAAVQAYTSINDPLVFTIITIFAQVADSNIRLLLSSLIAQEYQNMLAVLDLSCQMYQKLLKTAAVSLVKNLYSKAPSRAGSRQATPALGARGTRSRSRSSRSRGGSRASSRGVADSRYSSLASLTLASTLTLVLGDVDINFSIGGDN